MKITKNTKPPFLAAFFMKFFFPDYGKFTTLGDLNETYFYLIKKEGLRKAKWWYRKEVFNSVIPLFTHKFSWGINMLQNYIKLAWRNLIKHKTHSAINITGLTFGITASIIILLFIIDELSFDKFHHNYERMGRLYNEEFVTNGDNQKYPFVTSMAGKMLKENYPEVEDYVYLMNQNSYGRPIFTYEDKKFVESEFLVAGPNFFEVFDFRLIVGDSKTILSEPNVVVFTESGAKKYFGDEDPIGKTITSDRNGLDYKVAGIAEDPPSNSHLQFSMVLSLETLLSNDRFRQNFNNWDWSAVTTYLVFNNKNSLANFHPKLEEFVAKNKTKVFGVTEKLHLQSMKEIHFNSGHLIFDENYSARSITAIYVLGIIGFFIILSACINYSNLSIARYFNRAKEFGIRKVIGANTKEIFIQIISDALIMSVLSLIIAILFVNILLPPFNSYMQKNLSINFMDNFYLFGLVVFVALIIGTVSGILPAFFLTKVKTVSLFKLKLNPKGSINFVRKSLVVVQFVISIMMIFGTITVFKQMQFIKNKDLGFNKEQLLVIDINSRYARSSFQAIKSEFLKHPSVSSVSVSSRIPGDWKVIREVEALKLGQDLKERTKMNYIGADKDFLNTYKLKLVEGKNFTGNSSSDSLNIIINETAANIFGFDNPIGKTITLSEGDNSYNYKIVGILKDFNFHSLHQKISPLIVGFRLNPFISIDYFTAKFNVSNISESISYFQSVHEKFDKSTPMEFNFLDDRIEDFYRNDQREGTIINTSSIISIFIACLGLFGLASYTAQQKIKEIGIRKVLGASVSKISFSFSLGFLQLVIISAIIAIPIAFYFMDIWLNNFAYRIDIGLAEISLSALAALVISIVTISYQAIKSALNNPVDSLRSE